MLHASSIEMTMLPFPNRRSLSESVDHLRKMRTHVMIIAELKTVDGFRIKVALQDLSASGFHMRTANYLGVNQQVHLTIPAFESLPARIAWNVDEQYGCEFVRPLHDSIFAHIASKHPVLVAS